MGLHQVDQYMIMGVPERQGREKTGLFEQIMAKNFTKIKIENKSKLQQAQRTPKKINTKKY